VRLTMPHQQSTSTRNRVSTSGRRKSWAMPGMKKRARRYNFNFGKHFGARDSQRKNERPATRLKLQAVCFHGVIVGQLLGAVQG